MASIAAAQIVLDRTTISFPYPDISAYSMSVHQVEADSTRKRPLDDDDKAFDDHAPPRNSVTMVVAPSHILHDGSGVILPPPTQRQRNYCLEQALARHGLLQQDLLQGGKSKKQKLLAAAIDAEDALDDAASTADSEQPLEDATAKAAAKSEAPQIHPLAMASAILQTDAIQEVNRAINLCSLYPEYFDMSNIVVADTATAAVDKSKPNAANSNKSTVAATATSADDACDFAQEQRTKALFRLHRKRSQFQSAAKLLGRHYRRLELGLASQTRPDDRLLALRRQQWRLVAPEHASRAAPHAVRPTETIACDVDLYAVATTASDINASGLGRQAKHLPRLATIELKQEYDAKQDVKAWRRRVTALENTIEEDNGDMKHQADMETRDDHHLWTFAEPFAVYNPELGKIGVDFDPAKSPMLSLQFDIEKPSTGFCQTAQLQPLSVLDDSGDDGDATTQGGQHQDENVLASLQHSLLCATLFESIRRELAHDTEDIGNVRTNKAQSDVWLSSESENNFLPPPSLMSGGNTRCTSNLAPVCVIHCHEGEVKVQLDCEYTLTVKLVEAKDLSLASVAGSDEMDIGVFESPISNSGSQRPEQLLLLCRLLLIDAQERFHKHSIRTAEERKQQQENQTPGGHVFKYVETSPQILQHCCALGSKTLMEQRIRTTIRTVNRWLQAKSSINERLQNEWLSLSMFDLQAQFTVSYRSWVIDCIINGEEVAVTSTSDDGAYKKAKFHSDAEFELFLKMTLQRLLRNV